MLALPLALSRSRVRISGHDVLELRPQRLNGAELVANLAISRDVSKNSTHASEK